MLPRAVISWVRCVDRCRIRMLQRQCQVVQRQILLLFLTSGIGFALLLLLPDSRTNNLLLRDTDRALKEVERWVRQLDVPLK